MLHAESRKKSTEKNKKRTITCACVSLKKENVSAHTELAVSPCEAVITWSFKGAQGLQTTFSLNRVSFHLLFPATRRCAPY